jgi:serine/threonine protein kinase
MGVDHIGERPFLLCHVVEAFMSVDASSGVPPASNRANWSYAEFLMELGVEPNVVGIWAGIGRPPAAAGWKFHLSTVPCQAQDLIARVLPFLIETQCCFKLAKDCSTLESLNAGDFGSTQVGKFMTVYPTQSSLSGTALKLVELTKGLYGPAVPTDVQLGDVLYARYGDFINSTRLNRLGLRRRQFAMPDGEMRDDVYSVPYRDLPNVTNPFKGMIVSHSRTSSGQKLFGPGYRLLEVLQERPKGAVFTALDLRERSQVGACIIKQGRKHVMSDRFGRDIRWRLKNEFQHYVRLSGMKGVPVARDFFEAEGDAYLVIDYVPGRSFEQVISQCLQRRKWCDLAGAERIQILNYLADLSEIIARVGDIGLVHRDISHSNVWIGEDNTVTLLDFEMAQQVEDDSPSVGIGTPGFMSPQQEYGQPPTLKDDIFSFGSVVILAVTGIDPRRWKGHGLLAESVLRLTGAPDELKPLLGLVEQAHTPNPRSRPDIDMFTQAISEAIRSLRHSGNSHVIWSPITGETDSARFLLKAAVQGMLTSSPLGESGLWLSPPLGAGEQAVSVSDLEPLQSAHIGVAGVVYVISRLKRSGYSLDELNQRAHRAVQWLLSEPVTADGRLPGLHFGNAGVAVSLTEALRAGLTRNEDIQGKLDVSLTGALDWPDLTHGAAGQGVAALACAPSLSHRCVEYLVETQQPNGAWTVPPGIGKLSGQCLTGFAHGVAGIVYFLAEYLNRHGGSRAAQSLERAVNWLTEHSRTLEDGTVCWPYSDAQEAQWKWWCHGGPGIALAYLRLYETTGKSEYYAKAAAALRVHPRQIIYGNLSLCHGLAGLGEIYLEAYKVSGDEEWFNRAHGIVDALAGFGKSTAGGGLTWHVDNPAIVTADLGVGTGGIIHFLLRMTEGADSLCFPLLVDCGA